MSRTFLTLALCTMFAAGNAALAASLPNVVFIHSDDHGFADVGFRGSAIDTPNIDALAAAGVVLERYHTQPICGPTRVGLMTGRNPARMGVTGNFEDGEDGVPLDEHFLSQTFQSAGYQTWALGKWHLGGTTSPDYLPNARGFDHFYGFVGGSINETTHKIQSTGVLDWQRNGVDVPEDDGQLSTDLLADEAIALIENRDTGRPFFLYLAFHAVHSPYDAPASLKDKYAALGMTGQQLEYSAMVENMDSNIGRVLATLESQGLINDTLVVFASDNGADEGKGGSNLPLRGWKGEVYEGAFRTPAVLRWPGVLPANVTTEQFISHLDWLPTLASATGVMRRNHKPLDGRDRWGAILTGTSGRPHGYVVVRGQGTTVLNDHWKLLRTTKTGAWQLYDLYADPNETTDLAASEPDIAIEMEEFVDLLTTDTDGDFVADSADACTTSAVIPPPATPVEQAPIKTRLQLSNLDDGPGTHKILAKGYFNPASTSPAIDPSLNGVQVVFADDSGVRYDVSVPGGLIGASPCGEDDGWAVSGTPGKLRWKYVNKTGGLPDGLGGCSVGAANGLSQVLISDRTTSAKAAYAFKVLARGATLDAIPTLPLAGPTFSLVLAAASSPGVASAQALAGQCAEFRMTTEPLPSRSPKPYCSADPSEGPLSRIRCVGP